MNALGHWQSEVVVAVRRYPIVFVHLGRAHSPADVNPLEVLGRAVSVAEYLENPSVSQVGSDTGPENLTIIGDIESLIGSRRLTMGALRERVISDVDEGRRFVLRSKFARGAYPETVGSNLLVDAKQVFGPNVSGPGNSGVEAMPGWPGVSEAGPEGGKGEQIRSFLCDCVEELGVDTVEYVAELLWGASQSPNEAARSVSGVNLESLRSAGLMSIEEGDRSWSIGSEWSYFRDAVAKVSSRYAVAGDWLAQTFVDLWLIERLVRNAVREGLLAAQGSGWRNTCLPAQLEIEVVGRAQRDSQPSASKVSDLRDPLEWLSTGELLDLRSDRNLGLFGLEPHQWSRLRESLLPVRNRAAHMRPIGERDARTVATWRKLVERNLRV